ncbi:ERF family protein [Acidovorax sp. 22279]|uniref:ERF family protein n=1 Tax=Acidovorax sp. 22279 TaxID=3453900 RepID=UPI003F85299C
MNATDTADLLTLEPHQQKHHPLATAEPAALQVADTSPAAIMMNALARGADLSQIERMMDLQQQWQRQEAEKAYNLALADFKAENIKITKNKLVDFETRTGRTTYMHAELAQVVDAVGPALSRHGFGWSWKPEQSNGLIRVSCILRHRLGHQESVTLEARADESGGKNAIQAIVSTTTYLSRHTLKLITGTAESDDDEDDDGASYGHMGTQTMLEQWTQKVKATKTRAALTQVMRDAKDVFKGANDFTGYQSLMHIITQHGNSLPADPPTQPAQPAHA